ncbi:MAG TPA: gamma-glutamylcyclotransferase family protein, partial [Pyrinomonadaceae bacterium]|nr:gamma-glutamylcyclotransferase family protein [Pyrinomonadaceae bacterium]
NAALSTLPFFHKKEESLPYFAYGSSMCTRKFLERLGWKEEEKSLYKDMSPRAAELHGYRLAFNKKPEGDVPGEGAPNLVPAANEKVEGVLYELPQVAADFLSKTEKGYHSIKVKVLVGGKEVDAMTYVADAESSVEGLKPAKEFLDLIKEGAREHQLSAAYLQQLDSYETLPTSFMPVPDSASINTQTDAGGQTM